MRVSKSPPSADTSSSTSRGGGSWQCKVEISYALSQEDQPLIIESPYWSKGHLRQILVVCSLQLEAGLPKIGLQRIPLQYQVSPAVLRSSYGIVASERNDSIVESQEINGQTSHYWLPFKGRTTSRHRSAFIFVLRGLVLASVTWQNTYPRWAWYAATASMKAMYSGVGTIGGGRGGGIAAMTREFWVAARSLRSLPGRRCGNYRDEDEGRSWWERVLIMETWW